MLRYLPLLAALAATTASAQRAAPLPPALQWSGASERLIVHADDPWITPAERDGFDRTPDGSETRAWLDRLVASAPTLLSIEPFGRSAQGRELYFVRASKGGAAKPVLLVQAGIHAGEIDGKDAGLMLLRDIAHRGKDRLLDRVDLVFVPVFNADGHERASLWNRPNQRGPRNMGWRTTAQNLNLNRDYVKADAPEMQAMLRLIQRFDPALYLDLHVTDGIDHQYDITYAFSGWRGRYARSAAIGAWLDTQLRPAMDRALTRAGHIPGFYVSALSNTDPDKGIEHTPDTPRFSTGYGDVARIPTVLLETHSLKPYRQRVLGTYVFVEEALRLLGQESVGLRTAIARDRASRPDRLTVTWKPRAEPLYTLDFKGVAHDRYRSAASGREEIRWLGRPVMQKMPVFGPDPDKSVALPRAWWVPATARDVIARLKLHGIAYETIAAPRTLTLDTVRIGAPKLGNASEGHVPLTAGSYTHAPRRETFPAGSVRVPADQPLGLLAAVILEPESADSLLAWNFFPGMLQRTEYIEGYAIAPVADRMLAEDADLRRAFEARLAADPAFAADGSARLAWFYERTPYYDDRYLLYPVGRELR
ncbi:Murein tripeptide amidase MpaA [Sphingomonas guangdongensis]|uniref:Murein tripeptide amidase MpaA n=1 Tax=Sphingomonas guangdongensis TaxID=1141890 RepID=A0A285R769_9SPHN|nr:M14 family metallopeptidase [Sphingomonas guangdongensis]SOB88207.1 Murein tripeptide amidase MpaA [Sphingomonas guangdongensis]